MRRAELDAILETMLRSHDGISDFIFTVGRPFQVESDGVLKPVFGDPAVESLSPFQTEQIALALIGGSRRLLKEYCMLGACDSSYSLNSDLRFRVNVFKQRGHFAVVMRKLQTDAPTIDRMGLPPILKDISRERNGLVLVTGATGSGKTTTLAAVLEHINESLAVHVVTLEDPVEYVHPHLLATFSQRELGHDFDTYANGLRAALRQAPKVILVGEMRDRETVEIALTAAETGHLVLSTLHTIDAGQTINRILGMFSQREEQHVRARLSDTLRYVVSQRLAPRVGGGRHLLMEILGNNLRTREVVEQGESDERNFYNIIEVNRQNGWCTFDQAVLEGYESDLITEETALLYSTRRGVVMRALDTIKKARGGMGGPGGTGLRLDLAAKTERYTQ